MGAPSGTIAIELDLSAFASGPIGGSTWETLVRVDGVEHRFMGGSHHAIPCAPGHHAVEVEFAAAGLQLVAAALGYRAGLDRVEVVVESGQTVKLVYRGGMFWKYGDHSLVRVT